jgi:hypothetical protein
MADYRSSPPDYSGRRLVARQPAASCPVGIGFDMIRGGQQRHAHADLSVAIAFEHVDGARRQTAGTLSMASLCVASQADRLRAT